jgi:hypothetical protein
VISNSNRKICFYVTTSPIRPSAEQFKVTKLGHYKVGPPCTQRHIHRQPARMRRHACNRTREQGARLRHTGLSLNRAGGWPLMHSSRLQRVSAHSLQASTAKQQQLLIFRFDLRALKPCLKQATEGRQWDQAAEATFHIFVQAKMTRQQGETRSSRKFCIQFSKVVSLANGNKY